LRREEYIGWLLKGYLRFSSVLEIVAIARTGPSDQELARSMHYERAPCFRRLKQMVRR
jgi:hypothetical protein